MVQLPWLQSHQCLRQAVLALSLVLLSGTSAAQATDLKARPNIVFLVADDMGMSDLQPYGGEIATPTIGKLAQEGMLFTNFHTNAACSPTRSMLLSGVDNHRIGLGTMEGSIGPNQKDKPGYSTVLNLDVVTLPQLLKDAGYHTYMAGKWHLGHEPGYWPIDRGFEESLVMLPGGGSHYADMIEYSKDYKKAHYVNGRTTVKELAKDFYSTKNFTDRSIAFIEKNRKDEKPFFLYLAYTAPHGPLGCPDETLVNKYYQLYLKSGWDTIRAERLQRMKTLGIIPEHTELRQGWKWVKPWAELTDEEKKVNAKKMALYAAMIEYLDMSINRFIQYLRDSGEYDNTLFIVMSDNGADGHNNADHKFKPWIEKAKLNNSFDNMGKSGSFVTIPEGWAQVSSTPFLGSKGAVSEGGVRNSFIVHYPKAVKGGQQVRALTSVIDVTPTVLDYAEVTHPGSSYQGKTTFPMDGRSMRPLFEGTRSVQYAPDQGLMIELYGRMNKAFYLGDWKILRLGDHPFGGTEPAEWQLFNLAMDPAELVNLASQYPQQLQKMVQLYEAREKEVGYIASGAAGGEHH